MASSQYTFSTNTLVNDTGTLADDTVCTDTLQTLITPPEGQRHYNKFVEGLIVKTNGLYDMLLAPSIGMTYAFDSNWTVGAGAWIAWLRHQDSDLWWQNYGFDLYGHYWFGKHHNARDNRGWHGGVYAGTFTYDIWRHNKGYQNNHMFRTFRVGLEVGWSTGIGRKWRLDIYGGTGLLHTKQRIYHHNYGGGYYVSRVRYRNLVDFTRFGVTFGYILGHRPHKQ